MQSTPHSPLRAAGGLWSENFISGNRAAPNPLQFTYDACLADSKVLRFTWDLGPPERPLDRLYEEEGQVDRAGGRAGDGVRVRV